MGFLRLTVQVFQGFRVYGSGFRELFFVKKILTSSSPKHKKQTGSYTSTTEYAKEARKGSHLAPEMQNLLDSTYFRDPAAHLNRTIKLGYPIPILPSRSKPIRKGSLTQKPYVWVGILQYETLGYLNSRLLGYIIYGW